MKNPKLADLILGAVAALIVILGGVAALHAAEPQFAIADNATAEIAKARLPRSTFVQPAPTFFAAHAVNTTSVPALPSNAPGVLVFRDLSDGPFGNSGEKSQLWFVTTRELASFSTVVLQIVFPTNDVITLPAWTTGSYPVEAGAAFPVWDSTPTLFLNPSGVQYILSVFDPKTVALNSVRASGIPGVGPTITDVTTAYGGDKVNPEMTFVIEGAIGRDMPLQVVINGASVNPRAVEADYGKVVVHTSLDPVLAQYNYGFPARTWVITLEQNGWCATFVKETVNLKG